MKDARFLTEAGVVAARRMAGMFAKGLLGIELDGTVTQYEGPVGIVAQRRFLELDDIFPVMHREAYRELRMKAGVPANVATWEWHTWMEEQ